MKLYYRAVTRDGTTIRGLIEAKNIPEAAHSLRKHNLIPVKISSTSHSFFHLPFTFKGVSRNDIVFFTRQLASMLSSGLTLMQALSILKNQTQKKAMSEVTQVIVTDLENGKTFSSAIEKFPSIFSPVYIALIRTGEASGLLDKILLKLAENLEKEQELRGTIKNVLLYPAIVIVMMVLVVAVMMVFVIPQLSDLYSNIDKQLPLPTLIVINSSNILLNYWPYLLLLLVISIISVRKWYSNESGRRTVDTYLLKIPVVNKLIVETVMADFTRTLGLLIGSGSLVVESLLKTSGVVNNSVYKSEIVLIAKRVEKGISIGDALEASNIFPSMVVEMVRIGEQTGKLNESLMRASEYYEREIEGGVHTMTTILEPIILLFLALGVGFLIFAVVAPIYELVSSIQ